MYLIDTHTHLYDAIFETDLPLLIDNAKKANIQKFILPNVDEDTLKPLLNLSKRITKTFYPLVGLHPCSVNTRSQTQLDNIFETVNTENYYGVGEIGIDLYWDKTYIKQQIAAFEWQLNFAKEQQLPVVIHVREAHQTVIEVVKLFKYPFKGIFHCFTGTLEQAHEIIDLGFKIGIGGVLTFKNSGLDKVIEKIGLEHIVLETDAPYLAPSPHRGQRNIPEYLLLIAQKLADIKHKDLKDIAEITTHNALQVFNL